MSDRVGQAWQYGDWIVLIVEAGRRDHPVYMSEEWGEGWWHPVVTIATSGYGRDTVGRPDLWYESDNTPWEAERAIARVS